LTTSPAPVAENAAALAERFGSRVRLVVADVRDKGAVAEWVGQASAVFHFAAQVAVTTSLLDPIQDFDVNVRGTLNVLEALRRLSAPPPLVFTSTNKVYGALSDITLREGELRYTPFDETLASKGVDEVRPLSFCSPYGCSKGAADQYVLDYAHSFGLKAAVLRMSCIYGPRQFGNEDQGWVAHFLIKALRGEPITVYGDGKQVRDILFVSDLVDAMLLTRDGIDRLAGTAFNIGGGPSNVLSLLELLGFIEELTGRSAELQFDLVRTGDQPYYVSNTSRFQHATGWRPRVAARTGVHMLHDWLLRHRLDLSTHRELAASRGQPHDACTSGAST